MIKQTQSTWKWLASIWLVGTFIGVTSSVAAADLDPERASGEAIYIIGTQLMAPYTAAIATRLVQNTGLTPPVVVNQSTSKGIQSFCSGVGLHTPDVVAVSRRLREVEREDCRAHGVEDVIEIQIGYDATAVASRIDDLDYPLTLQSFYHAVAAELPDGYEFFPNTHSRWKQVDPALPDTEIRIVMPSPILGGRVFIENRMLEAACRNIFEINSIFSAEDRVKQCISLRQDERIIELDSSHNYADTVVHTLADLAPGTLALVPLRFATMHEKELKIQPFEGVMPNRETVSNHRYSLVRPLYFFIKKAHVKNYLGAGPVNGLRELITEMTRETTWGPDGYLADLGLFPMDDWERQQVRASSLQLSTVTR
jgi:phosphate transport system substrate-binding protein